MKNIEAILTEVGIELTDEQKTNINKAVSENYKTVTDYEKQKDKLEVAEQKAKATEDALKAFDGVDAEGMKKQIADLQADLSKKDIEFNSKIADRDFQDLVKNCISDAKGKNAKAIKALLDVESLKASTNQKEDIAKAIKELTEAEDSKMLFGEVTEVTTPIGSVGKPNGAMSGVEAAFYKRNPGLKQGE